MLNLNLGFLAAVDLPGTKFQELVKLWPSAVDSEEHDALAAIPLHRDVLRECLESESLPTSLWKAALKAEKTSLGEGDHLCHPTGRVRLAMCLWLLEGGLEG